MSEKKDSLILQIHRQTNKVAQAVLGPEELGHREIQDRITDLRELVQKLVDGEGENA